MFVQQCGNTRSTHEGVSMAAALVSAPRLAGGSILPRSRLVVVSSGAMYRRRRVAVAVVLALVVVLAALLVGRAAAVLGGGPASVSGHRTGTSAYGGPPGDAL